MAKKVLLKHRSSRDKEKTAVKRNKKKILWVVFVVVAFLAVLEIADIIQSRMRNIEVAAQVVLQFSGQDKPCGAFGAWDISAVGKDLIAVSDRSNARILFFDRQGQFLKAVGKKGEGPDGFKENCAITSDGQGNVYVIDSWGGNIHCYTSEGRKLDVVSLTPNFYGPRGLAWDKDHFLIADSGSHRIVKMSRDGKVLAVWGKKRGSGKQELSEPRALAVNSKGLCYVADQDNKRVQVINTLNGEFVKSLSVDAKPDDVAVDSKDRLFVASLDGHFLKMYDANGKFLGKIRNSGGASDTFNNINGLSATPDGTMLLTNGNSVMEIRVPDKP
jgi:sugar lactone lactonase YvrE